MLRPLACATGLSLVLAAHALAQDAEQGHEDVTLYRVFVGDHAAPKVTAFDLGDPAKRAARLATLARVRDAVDRVADFSRIEG